MSTAGLIIGMLLAGIAGTICERANNNRKKRKHEKRREEESKKHRII